MKLNRYGNPITNRKYRTQYQNVNRNIKVFQSGIYFK